MTTRSAVPARLTTALGERYHIERLVVEIKTTASLQHPHILPLFDSGEADGFLYYVMPLASVRYEMLAGDPPTK